MYVSVDVPELSQLPKLLIPVAGTTLGPSFCSLALANRHRIEGRHSPSLFLEGLPYFGGRLISGIKRETAKSKVVLDGAMDGSGSMLAPLDALLSSPALITWITAGRDGVNAVPALVCERSGV